MRIITLVVIYLLFNTNSLAQHELEMFFSSNQQLESKVDSIYWQLSNKEKVAQMIMPAVGKHGKPVSEVIDLIKQRKVGGILLLNGAKAEFSQLVATLDSIGELYGNLPFLYSADAEPSLIRYKIKGCASVPKANEHQSEIEVIKTAKSISSDLVDIGINYNFAPVVDQGNMNAAITNRSFGSNVDSISLWSNAFIQVSQQMGVIATAKHFPGHGLVHGDTHEKLVYIDGLLQEVVNYESLISGGVLSIMVGHIAVKNNPKYGTDGLPATCSKKIVTNLLKEELKFKGLIVTDAMNMGGVRNVTDCGMRAVDAGCDILLMPIDENKEIQTILAKYESSESFQCRVEESVKKIIRVKICLGIL
jgi:beta-N-acetylhexosaminidase